MKLGKRIVAGVLAGVLSVSSGLMSVSTVRAEEIAPKEIEEVITADDGAEEPGEELSGGSEGKIVDDPQEEAGGAEHEATDKSEGETTGVSNEGDSAPVDETDNESEDTALDEDESTEESAAESVDPEETLEIDGESIGTSAVDADVLSSRANVWVSGVIDEEYGQITWVIDTTWKLTVSGTGDYAPIGGNNRRAPWYNAHHANGFYYRDYIKDAEINVQGMKDASNMFYGCKALVNVDIHNFDTSQVTDMSGMFSGCRNVASYLDLSSLDTSQVTDMEGMFAGCFISSAMNLSSLDTSKVTNMREMFSGCEIADNLDFESWDTSRVTDMGDMFANCSISYQSRLSGLDTSQVINMSGMFSGFSRLDYLDLSNFDTSQVTDMGRMFANCSIPSDWDLSGLNTNQVTNMSEMFSGCTGLANLDFGTLNTSQVTDMRGMFADCSDLTTLDLSGLNTAQVTDMEGMFANCSSLTSLDLSSLDLGSLTMNSGGELFHGCDNLSTIYTPRNLTCAIGLPLVDKLWDAWYQFDGSKIQILPLNMSDSIVIRKNKIYEDHIVDGKYEDIIWFIDTNKKLTVEGTGEFAPSGSAHTSAPWAKYDFNSAEINVRGMKNASNMFSGCTGLTNLDLSGFDTSQVTDMEWMFQGCTSLTDLDLSSFDTSRVTDMRRMFSNCNNLTDLDLSNLDTSRVTDMGQMFYGCTGLTRLDLSNFSTENVTFMMEMFGECSNLVTIDLSSFNTSNVTEASFMFYGCNALVRLDLSSFDLGNWKADSGDGQTFFENCNNLEIIYTPRNLVYPIALPLAYKDLDVWYQPNESEIKYLPIYRSDSIVICKNKIHEDDIAGGRYKNIVWYIDANAKLTVRGTGNFASDDDYVANRAPWSGFSFDSAKVDVTGMTNAAYMFYNCDLINLDLSSFDTSQVKDMHGMFYGCYRLTNLDLSNFDTSQVTNMSSMFSGCGDLTDLELGNFDTSQVTDMDSMFSRCDGLTNLDLSNFDTSRVTSMNAMFYNCNNITNLDLSNFDTSQVTDMWRMFECCDSLTTLDLSNFDLSNLNSSNEHYDYSYEQLGIDYANLNTIYTPRNIPDSVHISVPDGTWYQPDKTEIVELPHLDYSIVIMRNKVPSVVDSHIAATKRKIVYKCGERLDISDLTVRYYGSDGKVIFVSDYTTNADQIDMSTPGIKSLVVTYNGLTTAVELTVAGTVAGKENVEILGLSIQDSVYSGKAVAYRGTVSVRTSGGEDVTTKTVLSYTYSGTLADGSSYPASDSAPVDVGQYTLKVSVLQDDDNYTGSAEYAFSIRPASVTIMVSDKVYVVGEGQSLPDLYEFETKGLLKGDQLTKQPVFIFTDINGKEINKGSIKLDEEGTYYIVPMDADAGINYEITYQKGILSIMEERVAFTVRFDLNGRAGEIPSITGIKAGNLIAAPENPEADGYIFKGWYKDSACSKVWDFHADTVQENTVLYARWLVAVSVDTQGADLCIQEIQPQIYTGNALKPTVSVYASDGETLLRVGKDYTIKYCNNVEADNADEEEMGGVSPTGQEGENRFTKNLAHVIITGKGNYVGTVYQNFHIKAASIAMGDGKGSQTAAPGFTLKYTEQMAVNASKAQKPFTSLKYKKAMKEGKDYEVVLSALQAYDGAGNDLGKGSVISKSDGAGSLPVIPKGYRGTFLMAVTGIGNYTGSIEKTVYVADKMYLLKNASITLGKNQKVIKGKTAEELKKGIALTPAYYNTSDKKYYIVGENGTVNTNAEPDGSNVFTVKAGKICLVYGQDYTVSYANNRAVGTAVMTITGIGKYAGTKNINFKIAGMPFNARNIVVDTAGLQTILPYSGKVLTQNKAVLYPKKGSVADALTYGVDYTIGYKNNVNKGTATMTFTAKPDSGYSGSFKKSFKIAQTELSNLVAVTDAVSSTGQNGGNPVKYDGNGEIRLEKPVPYTRAGVKPSGQIRLVNRETGAALKEGQDYRISYKNNNAVTAGQTIAADKKPVMFITGKGNYTGALAVYFEISSGEISPDDIIVPALALNTKNNYQYVPKIKVMDGKKALRAGADKDYAITYKNNDQANATRYVNGEAGAEGPEAVISVPSGSSYRLINAAGETVPEIRVPLKLYRQTLKKGELYVIVEEPVYSGSQLRPQGDQVRVYIGDSSSVKAAYKSKEDKEAVLTAQAGQYRLTRLEEGTDYTLGYGANTAAGKNKGSLTIIGGSRKYGGSVTVKFTILRKEVYKN